MTDFGLEGFDPRRARSERVFWMYVLGSILVHVALVSWLVTAGFDLPAAAPAILVRLVNPGADEPSGGPGGDDGGPAPALAAGALSRPAAPAPSPADQPLPAVSPVKDEPKPDVVPATAPVPAIDPTPTSALNPGGSGPDSAGPGGTDDGSGPGGTGGSGIGPGGPGGGSGVDPTGRKRLPASYTNDMSRRIRKNRNYPMTCREQGIEGTVRVWVRVNADGTVDEVRLATSSGSAELDRAGLTAVEKTTFAPFPDGYDQTSEAMKLAVDFHLND